MFFKLQEVITIFSNQSITSILFISTNITLDLSRTVIRIVARTHTTFFFANWLPQVITDGKRLAYISELPPVRHVFNSCLHQFELIYLVIKRHNPTPSNTLPSPFPVSPVPPSVALALYARPANRSRPLPQRCRHSVEY